MDSDKLEQLIQELLNNSLSKERFGQLPETEQKILDLVSEMKYIPVQSVPKPQMRRQFETQKTAALGFGRLFFSFKFGLGLITLLLLGGIGAIGFSASSSLPGESLFSIKKTAEQLRIKFAGSDIQKAYLQLQIAKKRVAEAQKLVAGPHNQNSGLELAAFQEVSAATEAATEKVQTLSPKTIKSSSQPLLSALEDVTNQQKDLATTLAARDQNKQIDKDVIASSLKNLANVSKIKQAVAVATAEEAVASLSADPNDVLISGQITQAGKNTITVEKTTFVLDENTSIVLQNGQVSHSEILKLGDKVAVSGKKAEAKLVAIKVTLFENAKAKKDGAEEGQVKGESVNEANKPNSSTPVSILKPKNEASAETDQPAAQNPNQATGSFIIETPLPQYNP